MIDDPLLGILGPFIVELRQDADVLAAVGRDENQLVRVRGFEPAAGDVQQSGKYRPFIVVSVLSAVPDPDMPVTFATLGFRCYGNQPKDAWNVYGAIVKAVHRAGPRIVSALGIYQTLVVSGGSQGNDPDTRQPVINGTLALLATAQAIAA